MDVVLGLLAALFWGGTDFLVGLNARAVGVKRAVYFGQALGFLIMCILLLCIRLSSPNHSLPLGLFGF